MSTNSPPAGTATMALFASLGVAVLLAPADWKSPVRTTVRDVASPGQQLLSSLLSRGRRLVRDLPRLSHDAARIAELEDELDAARHDRRRAVLSAARLREQLDRINSSRPRPPPGAPLLIPHLVAARVLGRETAEACRAGRLLDRGTADGIPREALVLDPARPTLDLGRDAAVTPGQPVFAGSSVVGRIVRVGRWTSTVQPLTDPEFRGLAQLVRHAGGRPVFAATGMLEGTRGGVCRLTLVRSTEAVRIGDEVVTGGRDSSFPWPLVYGTVISARLAPRAPYWEILVKPAVGDEPLEIVEVFTRALNPERVMAQ